MSLIDRSRCRQCLRPLVPGKIYPTKAMAGSSRGYRDAIGGFCESCHEQYGYNPMAQCDSKKVRRPQSLHWEDPDELDAAQHA
jgi:RNase P subunit RPR2